MIKDSGERRVFPTGAVRDMQEGKGRCDLMPLDVVAQVLSSQNKQNQVVSYLGDFLKNGDTTSLYRALYRFLTVREWDTFTMILEAAKQFEEGAKKYGENNWQKGLPVNCYIDSAVRHYLKYLRGDADEPHDRAFVWNIMCCIWTVEHQSEEASHER